MITTSHLHPMLVHFPIALIVFGFLAVLASLVFRKESSLPKLAFYLLIIGTLTALTGVLSGVLFTGEMTGSAGAVQETHEMFAWITLALSIATSVFWSFLKIKKQEDSGLKWAIFVLYGLAAISVSITGYFGGTLVYNYMMPI